MLSHLHSLIAERNSPEQTDVLQRFADLYFSGAPQDELQQRDVADLYGATLSCWQFVQQRAGQAIKVRVFNPDYENHGWQSLHSVVEILCDDAPFLVDSVRMLLNARQLSLHAIHYCVLQAQRDGKGQLDTGTAWDQPRPQQTAAQPAPEAIIYVEFDHHSDAGFLQQLNQEIQAVLAEVQACVGDFPAMLARLQQVQQHLEKPHSKERTSDYQQAADFLRWLGNNHFTFLACDEFKLDTGGKEPVIERVAGADLGLSRHYPASRQVIPLAELDSEVQAFITSPQLISFVKSGSRSRVHRPAYPDYVVIKFFDAKGTVTGGVRFLGLYTSMVYIETPNSVPLVKEKLQAVRDMAAFSAGSHSAKELNRILEVYPRDELFQSTAEQLLKTALNILHIQERRQTRVFLRKDAYSKFLSCLLYVPRDIYNTELRCKIEQVLMQEVPTLDIEFNTYFSESILARTHFMLRLDPQQPLEYDEAALIKKVLQVARSWQDELQATLIEQVGEELGNHQFHLYNSAFPAGYREAFNVRTAVADVQYMENLCTQDAGELGMSFYREPEEAANELRFKLFSRDQILPLSDVIPVLENLGLRVLGEHPYEILRSDGQRFWMHNFQLRYRLSDSINITAVKSLFQDAFRAVWQGQAENDGFNRLVLGAELSWRDIAVLRAYSRYMKQIRFGISEQTIADTLSRYIDISARLVQFFHSRFDLRNKTPDQRQSALEKQQQQLIGALESVAQLNEERTIRRYIELINATLRTNFYQLDEQSNNKPTLAFKLNPAAISDMPLPRPVAEIFVYSPRVEGVHLRGGRVARGGLRWSDRADDFRTEVLGLVKAQQVKNAVIVPVGAKGGFVAKCLPAEGSRDEIQAEGIACYQAFISALLDVTDNLVEGELVPPAQLVRYDGDDPYLVVAADKGTASFSDIANAIAVARGFWMGDAFASGGSVGYDHKKMGITARGAWISVQRHFRERAINVQETDITAVGIGDMAGDVFGNGMLMSEHIRLVGAFNHQHIFIDPQPEAARSFAERQRLFQLPRSSWADYNKDLISAGGGVFLRSAKSIAISPEMQQRFAITDERLTPNELIKAMLRAPVDLLWNGGIGTYIKASAEWHSQVGDKANDGLRVDGNEVRATVIGEGGNLGMTQLGRIEYSLNGGACFTDFIDNAGGVNCSDHEVNIKIMLNEVVAAGDLTVKQRNEIFMAQTAAVGELVLQDNYQQTQAIALAVADSQLRLDEYIRLIRDFEQQGKLNRALEFLPADEQLAERRSSGRGLTRPELAVLIAYTKADLKEQLNQAELVSDPYVAAMMQHAFPQALNEQFPQALEQHRLRNEIIATQLANDMVNAMGITYVSRLRDATGAGIAAIARAYLAVRDIFAMPYYRQQISALDYRVPAEVQADMQADLMRLVRRASRWFLRNRRQNLNIAAEVDCFRPAVDALIRRMGELLQGSAHEHWQSLYETRLAAGVPDDLAHFTAAAANLFAAPGIIEAAAQTGREVCEVAAAYYQLGEHLSLIWFLQQINALPSASRWEALARESLRDDLDWQQRALTVGILHNQPAGATLDEALTVWEEQQQELVQRWKAMLTELGTAGTLEFTMASVALRELLDLAQASRPDGF